MESTTATEEGAARNRFPNFSWPKQFRWPENWPKPPPLHKFKPPKLAGPWKIAAWVIGGIVVGILLLWVILNFMLANPRTGTPMINWTLKTFGDKSARVTTGKLAHPFSGRFILSSLDWPGTAEAEIIHIEYDLFGFLPNHSWAKKMIVRNGEVILEDKETNRKTFKPQALVDAIEAENVVLKFTRRDKLKEVTIVRASGSFSSGTVEGEATSGRNTLTFDNLRREWDGSLRGAITAKGENLKELAEIVGASSPDTPPFDMKGELKMFERVWSVNDITGSMGDSDIGGDVAVDLKPEKPFLTVALKSSRLDFDDLGVVFGIPTGVGRGETSNEEQRDAKAKFDASSRLIPDTKIDFARLAAVNADITFDAPKVVDGAFGINAMMFRADLNDMVLDFERFLVRTGTGDLDAKVTINAKSDPATTKASGKLEKVNINRFVNTPYVRGTLNGVFALNLTGSGFREAFGSATGEAGVWSTNSEVAKIATEAAGLDIGEILLLLAKDDDREFLKSRCMAANLSFRNGAANFNPAVLDNEDSLIIATGGFDLSTERLNIGITAKPHDISIGRLFGDIKITGTMRRPQLQALNEETVLQAGLTAVLAGITGALGALPFLEIGGEEEAPCQQLLADSRTLSKSPGPTDNRTDAQKAAARKG